MRATLLPTLTVVSVFALGCSGKKAGPGTPAGVHIAGKVVTLTDVPVANAQVLVAGRLVTTNSAGTFTLDGVVPPYTLAFNDTLGNRVTIFKGVTRTDPVLRAAIGAIARSAGLSGAMTPATGTGEGYVSFLEDANLGEPTPSTGPDNFAITASWAGETTCTSRVGAVRYTADASGNVLSIASYGTLDLSVTDNVPQAGLSIPMSPVASGSVSASVQLPAGFTNAGLSGYALDGVSRVPILMLGSTTNPTATFVTLDEPGFGVGLLARALPPGAHSALDGFSEAMAITPPSSALVIHLPGIPAITAPADGATILAGETLTWTAGTTGSGFRLFLTPTGGGPQIIVTTPATSFTLPNLGAFGGVAAPTAYQATVTESVPALTSDEQLAPVPPNDPLSFADFAASAARNVTASF